MKLFTAVGLLALSNVLALGVVQPENRNLQDEKVIHFMEEVETPESAYELLSCEDDKTTVDDGEVDLATIVNIGEKVWKVIQDNKAVLNTKTTYANALPKGLNGSDLENFSSPQFRSFRMYGKNLFGMTVYDVTYTVVHRYGGTFEGKGKYVENVTVLPHQVSALWGYNVNMLVSNVSASNVGSKESPIGSVMMEMYFRVSTVFKVMEYRNVFEFRGDSAAVKTIEFKK